MGARSRFLQGGSEIRRLASRQPMTPAHPLAPGDALAGFGENGARNRGSRRSFLRCSGELGCECVSTHLMGGPGSRASAGSTFCAWPPVTARQTLRDTALRTFLKAPRTWELRKWAGAMSSSASSHSRIAFLLCFSRFATSQPSFFPNHGIRSFASILGRNDRVCKRFMFLWASAGKGKPAVLRNISEALEVSLGHHRRVGGGAIRNRLRPASGI